VELGSIHEIKADHRGISQVKDMLFLVVYNLNDAAQSEGLNLALSSHADCNIIGKCLDYEE